MEIFGNIIVSIITASLTFIITRYEIFKNVQLINSRYPIINSIIQLLYGGRP